MKIFPLDKTDQIPNQADGKSPLDTVGMVKGVFTRDNMKLYFHVYVIKQLSHPIICELLFIYRNNIVQFAFKRRNIAFARGGAHLPIAHALRLLSTQELRFGLTKLKLRKNNFLK